MSKTKPSNPATRKAPNRINGDVKGGAFVQGENNGTVLSVVGGDAGELADQLDRAISGVLGRVISDLENYSTPRGRRKP